MGKFDLSCPSFAVFIDVTPCRMLIAPFGQKVVFQGDFLAVLGPVATIFQG